MGNGIGIGIGNEWDMNGKWKKPNIPVSRTGRQLEFRIPAGGSEMILRYNYGIIGTIFRCKRNTATATTVTIALGGRYKYGTPMNRDSGTDGPREDRQNGFVRVRCLKNKRPLHRQRR